MAILISRNKKGIEGDVPEIWGRKTRMQDEEPIQGTYVTEVTLKNS